MNVYAHGTPEAAALIARADLWSVDWDAEKLQAKSPEEAIRDWLDEISERELPLEITVWAWTRADIIGFLGDGRDLIEQLIERLDEELGNPEDSSDGLDQPSAELLAQAAALCRAIEREYKPWACDRIGAVLLPNPFAEPPMPELEQ